MKLNKIALYLLTFFLAVSCRESGEKSETTISVEKEISKENKSQSDLENLEPDSLNQKDSELQETSTTPINEEETTTKPEANPTPVITPVEVEETHVPEPSTIQIITKDIESYLYHLSERDVEKVMAFINPKILAQTPQSDFVSMFELMNELDIKNELISTDSISEIIDTQDSEYCKVHFINHVEMLIPQEYASNSEAYIQMLQSSGATNVTFNEDKTRVSFSKNSALLASKDKGNKNWKYLDIDPNMSETYFSLFPESVVSEFLK